MNYPVSKLQILDCSAPLNKQSGQMCRSPEICHRCIGSPSKSTWYTHFPVKKYAILAPIWTSQEAKTIYNSWQMYQRFAIDALASLQKCTCTLVGVRVRVRFRLVLVLGLGLKGSPQKSSQFDLAEILGGISSLQVMDAKNEKNQLRLAVVFLHL